MKNIDRITEAYFGKMGAFLMEACKNRINWICSQAKGEKILDVGCSQGISSIILAREGKRVVGIDICQESIDFANNSLIDEDSSTRDFVEFLCTDFISYTEKAKQKYDSIIMGEVLEHLTDPDRFIARAFECLTESGMFIATVPFGINDYHDHKRTYYLTELYQSISKSFSVIDIIFLGSWIGMVATKLGDSTIALDDAIFARAEKAFLAHERNILNRITTLKATVESRDEQLKQRDSRIEEARLKYTEANKDLETWKAKSTENHVKFTEASKDLEAWKIKSEETHTKLIDANRGLETWKAKSEDNHTKLIEANRDLEVWKAKVEENLLKYEKSIKEFETWKIKAKEDHARHTKSTESTIATLRANLVDVTSKLRQAEEELANKESGYQATLDLKQAIYSRDAWKTKAEENLAESQEATKAKDYWKTTTSEWKAKAEENLTKLQVATESSNYWKTNSADWKAKAEENLTKHNESTNARDYWRATSEDWKATAEKNLARCQQAVDSLDALSKSRLGKIQLSIWKRRSRKKRK